MGYGYGVWLVVQDFNIQRMVRKYNTKPHIAHITVMCNMTDTDAFKLAQELKGNYSATILNRYVHFNKNSDKYSDDDNDNLAASGYYCIVDNWREITEIAKYYKGTIPEMPHISIAYRDSEADLPTHIETEFIATQCIASAININDDNPSEWYYINQTKPTNG